jgi:hypothetical protein
MRDEAPLAYPLLADGCDALAAGISSPKERNTL